VIPAASARLVSPTFRHMTLTAVAIGGLSSLAGLAVSYLADMPSGATIVLVQAALFFGLVLGSRRS
jgi:zinc transport system permease protein